MVDHRIVLSRFTPLATQLAGAGSRWIDNLTHSNTKEIIMSVGSDTWDVEVKEEAQNYEAPPEGSFAARVAALIDVGFHDATGEDGSKYQRRVAIIAYELAKTNKAGKPFVMARVYTLSLAQNAALYKVIKALSGEKAVGTSFDPNWIAGKPCLVSITHSVKNKRGKDRIYANISGVAALPEEMKSPKGGCVVWSIRQRQTVPLPDVTFVPSLYHEDSGQMLTVPHWVNRSSEVQTDGHPVAVPTKPNGKSVPTADVYTPPADSDIPF